MKIKLFTKQAEFESLHRQVDAARGKTLIVNKAILLKLLMDHSQLYETCRKRNEIIEK